MVGAEPRKRDIYLIEDYPYGDLRYAGQQKPSFKQLIPEKLFYWDLSLNLWCQDSGLAGLLPSPRFMKNCL